MLLLRGAARAAAAARRRPLAALAPADRGPAGPIHREIMDQAESLFASVTALNERVQGPLERHSDPSTALPFVFVLGNHSSGKSSFINYVLGREVQTTGVAPTDDSFSIIAPGSADFDQDGPALVGDPDLGFRGLRPFGPNLIHHVALKVRAGTTNEDFMLVDSPGMIDSPNTASYGHGGDPTEQLDSLARSRMDRGYDFPGVVRWMAERADVILLFFDPDKPGTTGETLSVLTSSLAGLDHKLHIVLNKVDQFTKVHDFARAYGSLCWNLSKDLPRIYTMYIPTPDLEQQGGGLQQGLHDLERSRADIVNEVLKAPERRIDNQITRLNDAVHMLAMHTQMLEAVRKEYSRAVWQARGAVGAWVALSTAAAMSALMVGEVPVAAALGALGTLGGAGGTFYSSRTLGKTAAELTSPEGLHELFRRHHRLELAEGDEFVASVWARTREQLALAIETIGVHRLPRIPAKELRELRDIVDKEVPRMRRLAAPLGSDSDF